MSEWTKELEAKIRTAVEGRWLIPSVEAEAILAALDATRARAEAAEAQLAALREAAVVLPYQSAVGAHCLLCSATTYTRGSEPFHSDTCPVRAAGATAEAYTRRVRAQALRETRELLVKKSDAAHERSRSTIAGTLNEARSTTEAATWLRAAYLLRAEAERIEGGS